MDLKTDSNVNCKDNLSCDSPTQSNFDLRYVSVNTSGPFRHSIRALVLCNSRACVVSDSDKTDKPRTIEAHTTVSARRTVVTDDGNKTQAEETRTDTRKILLSDSVDSYKMSRRPCNVFVPNINRDSFIRSKDKYSNEGLTCTCDISCSTEYLECKNRGTQKIFPNNNRKQSFNTKSSLIRRESKVTFKNEVKCVGNADCGTSHSQLVEDKNCTNKTTYCRPIGDMYSREFISKCNERNNKLQKVVRKLVEVREREKQKEAWNNFINGLKNKHGSYTNVPTIDIVERRPDNVVLIDDYLDTRLTTNQSGPCNNLLQDIYASNNELQPRYIYSKPAVLPDLNSTNSIHRHDRRRAYEYDRLCYPISSQGRLLMSKRKKLKDGNCNTDFICRHGNANRIIVPKCRPKSKTKHRNSSIQTEDVPSLYEESDQDQRNSNIDDDEEKETIKNETLEREQSQNEMNERLEREREENERNARLEMETEERRQRESDKKLQKEASKKGLKENSLEAIESKLDSLIDSINTLIVEIKTKKGLLQVRSVPKLNKCTLATCISRKNLAAFLEESSDETESINVPPEPAKCCKKNKFDQNKVSQPVKKQKDYIDNESSDIDNNQPNSSQISSTDNGNNQQNVLKRTSISDKNSINYDPDTPCQLCKEKCLNSHDQEGLRTISLSAEANTLNSVNKIQNNNSDDDKSDKNDKIVCCMSTDPSFSLSERFQRSKFNKILIEEIDKSNQAKREIEEIINRELSHPCNVEITIDIPTKERSTEVTASLSKTRQHFHNQSRMNEERRMTIAVNTDPLSLLSLLRISTETIGRLLSAVNYNSYLSMIQLPQLSRRMETTSSQISRYICNVCGAMFMRASQLNNHIQGHGLGNSRDCCVCRHILDLQRRPAGRFQCRYCGQSFTRAYCCELHQQSCAKRYGRIHNVDESLILLQ